MPRRRKTSDIASLIGLVAVLIAVPPVVRALASIQWNSNQWPTVILLVAIATILSWPGIKLIAAWSRKTRLKSRITNLVSEHRDALVTQRAQKLQEDAYGTLIYDRWNKEILRFLRTKTLAPKDKKLLETNRTYWIEHVEHLVSRLARNNPALVEFDPGMSANEFEFFCAKELEAAGWTARVTSASRDQGADIIAEKNGVRLVVQCKKYSQPVGNKAVQEIVAAMNHQRAQYGCVVTNNTYTRAADELASTNRILLLHFGDLRKIDENLGMEVAE